MKGGSRRGNSTSFPGCLAARRRPRGCPARKTWVHGAMATQRRSFARSCWFHWVSAKLRTVADAIAFMITDLIIFTFHFTSMSAFLSFRCVKPLLCPNSCAHILPVSLRSLGDCRQSSTCAEVAVRRAAADQMSTPLLASCSRGRAEKKGSFDDFEVKIHLMYRVAVAPHHL